MDFFDPTDGRYPHRLKLSLKDLLHFPVLRLSSSTQIPVKIPKNTVVTERNRRARPAIKTIPLYTETLSGLDLLSSAACCFRIG